MEESSKLKKDATTLAEKIFMDTRAEINSIKETVRKEVDERLKTARQSLQDEAIVLADTITEKVIGRRVGN